MAGPRPGGGLLDPPPSWARGAAGGLLLRPWLDRAILAILLRRWFPMARLWAAAELAGDDPDLLAAEAPMAPLSGRARDRLRRRLLALSARRRAAAEAEERWREAFFGPRSGGGDPGEAERERRRRSARYMAARNAFWPWAGRAPPVRFAPVSPDRMERDHGRYRADAAGLFRPEEGKIEVSASLAGDGVVERWLRLPAGHPETGAGAWAHVFEPAGGYDCTAVLCHGIGMEAEMWRHGAHMAAPLVRLGVRVIEPEAPWHSRRRPPGRHGGEPFIALGPAGALLNFAAQLREIGALIGWARETGGGRVGLGGLSLGALAAQLAAQHAGAWPQACRPDAALLIATTDRMDDIAWRSSFSRGMKAGPALRRAGWTEEATDSWMPLLAPLDDPWLDPGRIVMALGAADTVTPIAGGRAFARRWRIPPSNLFETRQGHFTLGIGLARAPAPYARLAALLRS